MDKAPKMQENQPQESLKKISGLYQDWFLDYASYVILDRAIPSVYDGLKPVQRRILHSMRELEDGRYNKVANIVGNTMKYHPHGDASITDAMVQIGQKELLIDTQGNWGNIYTGDSAAAARYIEARLTPFALEVIYNPKTTPWVKSYDGRNDEPVHFPVKFPLLLAQGVEGIGVGLSTKIMPHNFNELVDACIAHLRGKKFELFPDFLTGGLLDISGYMDGKRGGKIRSRARITQKDRHSLSITELPYSKTTTDLIDNIIKANEKGKIKIKKIEDNTSDQVEISIHLSPDVSPDITIDALYAFTDCEVAISPNACVITDKQPEFLSVSDILRSNVDFTVELLRQELKIELAELEAKWHFSNLEKIFIENEIYQEIRDKKSKEEAYTAVMQALIPFEKYLQLEIVKDDIIRLTELPFIRISRYDRDKAQENITSLENRIEEVKKHLEHLVEYAIAWFSHIKKKYGKNYPRKTELRAFDTIVASKVAIANEKFYVNRAEGFVGTSLKKDEFVFECSDLDDIIIFRRDGVMQVVKVEAKTFVGKDILHVGIWKKADQRTIYNMIYREGKAGATYMKRFAVTGLTRNTPYPLASDTPGSEVLWLSANPNGEAEVVNVTFRPTARVRVPRLEIDFADLMIKGRGSKGNLVTKQPVKKIELKTEGISTLAPRKIWFDPIIRRLNVDGQGDYLGSFQGDDKILILMPSGEARLINFDLSNRFDDPHLLIEKWDPQRPIACIYYDGERERFFLKRFLLDATAAPQVFFTENHSRSYLEWVSTAAGATATLVYPSIKGTSKKPESIEIDTFISIKGIKAMGNTLSKEKLKKIQIDIPEPIEKIDESPISTPETPPKEEKKPPVEEIQTSLFD